MKCKIEKRKEKKSFFLWNWLSALVILLIFFPLLVFLGPSQVWVSVFTRPQNQSGSP